MDIPPDFSRVPLRVLVPLFEKHCASPLARQSRHEEGSWVMSVPSMLLDQESEVNSRWDLDLLFLMNLLSLSFLGGFFCRAYSHIVLQPSRWCWQLVFRQVGFRNQSLYTHTPLHSHFYIDAHLTLNSVIRQNKL